MTRNDVTETIIAIRIRSGSMSGKFLPYRTY